MQGGIVDGLNKGGLPVSRRNYEYIDGVRT